MTFSLPDMLKYFLEPLAYLVYTIIFFLKLKQGRSIGLRILFWYYLVSTVLLIRANLLVVSPTQDIDNDWIYNVVYFITIYTMSWYFYRLLRAKQKKRFIISCVVVNTIAFFGYEIILHHFIGAYSSHVYAFPSSA